MGEISRYLRSTIGTKQLIGISGLGLSLFLLLHMAGNLLILVSPEAYNEYSHKLITNPFLYVAEIGLLVLFIVHVVRTTYLTIINKRARDVAYAVNSKGEKHTTPVSRTLFAQGAVIFVFVILHLITFRYGPHYTVTYNGVEMRDLYKLVLEVFRLPSYVAWYIFALVILSLHLGHGLYSSLQTLGLNHPKYTPALKFFGLAYDVIVSAGFIVLPLYVYFLKG